MSPFINRYYPGSPYAIPSLRTVAPLSSYYRYAPAVAPVARIASIVKDGVVAPNKVETINGSPIAPIAPFATLPGYASRLYVRSY